MNVIDGTAAHEPTILATSGAWRVASGEATVFAVELDDDNKPRGRRSFIGATAAGGAVFGSSFTDDGKRFGIVAVSAPGALEPIVLEELATDERDHIVRSYLSFAFGESPELAERGRELTIASKKTKITVDEGLRVVATTPLAYAQIEGGSADYFGLTLGPGDVVAVSRQHALRAIAPSLIASLGRPADVNPSDVKAALANVTRAMWLAWREQIGQEEDRRRLRFAATRDHDRTSLHHSIDAATHVLDPESSTPPAHDDPIVAAAHLVAHASGVTIEAPTAHYPSAEAMVRAISEASQVPIRRVALRGRWWHSDQGPILGTCDGKPVALLPAITGRRYVMVDPELPAKRRLVDDALARRIETNGWIFIQTLPTRPIGVRDLIRVALPGSHGDLFGIIVFGIIAGLLGTVPPLAIGIVYGAIIPNGLRGSIGLIALALVLTGAAATVVELVRNLLVLRFQTRTSGKAQAAVMARLLSLPAGFFRRFAIGDLADRSLAIEDIQQYVTGVTLSVVLGAIFSLSGFLIVVYYDARLALICGALAVVAIAAATIEALLALPLYRDITMRGGAISAYVLQVIAGIAKLRVGRAESRAFVGWLDRFVAIRRLTARVGTIEYRFSIFQALFPGIAMLVIVAEVAVFRSDTISAAAFLAISAAFGQVLGALIGLGDAFTQIIRVVPIYERAKPLLEALPELHEANADPGRLSGAIRLRRVAFSYVEGRRILDQIDLSIAPGEFVAIVGSSGSGKSTLFRLLLGFEQPEEGAILYDGHDLATLDVGAVRRQIGCVLQTAKTLPGSIYENIACGTILTHDEAWEAARSVGLASDLAAMPMQLETMIGDDGGGLSGGQRQRILIARALAHKPRIVLFDEATSALDNQTQAIVTESLRNMRATRVVIAHRLSTIVNADRIVVLDRGHIVQQGSYAQLVDTPGLFADLAARQRL
ncbi:MAG TPA: NHLP bacteriocin export ABC transporter permease/ATPase subunit [Candidatus Acidoferrales bacterium]|nr:NHLP bacteriocin export ABC transporter permease/ATPase subunit [Candidatus Acidoferrales bacterium]